MDDFGIIKLQNIAYVNSQIASFYAELEAMKSENLQAEHLGQSMPWSYNEFNSLIDKYQLGHNAVLTNFQNGL
jgi:hypothetical protein